MDVTAFRAEREGLYFHSVQRKEEREGGRGRERERCKGTGGRE